MTENERREEARKAVRAYLARRSGIALAIPAITRGLKHEGGFEQNAVSDALNHLIGRGHVQRDYDGDGASQYYQITAEGELYHERQG